MRTVDMSQHEEVLIKFDQAVRSVLERVLGVPLSEAQWTQASIPAALGGIGLRQAALHGQATFPARSSEQRATTQSVGTPIACFQLVVIH